MNAEPVRVAHVVSRLNAGGIAVQVLNVVSVIDDDEFECHVVAGSVPDGEADMLNFAQRPKRLKIIPEMSRRIHPLADLVAIIKLCDYFRDIRPAIVHTHASKAGALGRVAAIIANVPVVIHSYHGHVFRHYFGPMGSRAAVWTERILSRVTDALCFPCESQAREVTDGFRIAPYSKARIVRYGVDFDKLSSFPHGRKYARKYLGLPVNRPIIGSVGRLAPIKNHGLLIDAFKILRGQMNAALLIHGGGECKQGIKASVEAMGLADDVYFVPWVDDLRVVYAAMDVLVITSKAEGMPISAIEAMAAGVPVVASAVGGLPELLGDGRGILIDSVSPSVFAAWIRRAFYAKPLASAGRNYVRDRHGISSLAGDTMALYRDLLGRPR